MKTKVLLFFTILISVSIYSQSHFVASGDIFGNRVFIKNKGQFDGLIPLVYNNNEIKYAYINGNEKVFFSNTSVTYLLEKNKPLTEHQREEIEHGKKIVIPKVKTAIVSVSWLNANSNIEIVESEKQSFYHSFGEEKYKSDCYKKITYKNVYNNIDIEYLFTSERNDGIKYNVLLHPGANVSDIKIEYSGDVSSIKLKNDLVSIQNSVQNITELAPISYQNGKEIKSQFVLDDNIISFKFPNGYDTTAEAIIDPWVVSYTSLTTSNIGYDVDFDNAGNYFVYGGGLQDPLYGMSGECLLAKYTPAGSLLWTFNGIISTIGWTSDPMSNFVVDKITGKSYIGNTDMSSSGRVVRLMQTGLYDSFVSTPDPKLNEINDMGYDPCTSAIYSFGAGTGLPVHNVAAAILNTTSGAMPMQNFIGSLLYRRDVVSHTIDPSGNVFMVVTYITSGMPKINYLIKANSGFTANLFGVASTYTTLPEAQCRKYGGVFFGNSSNGYNALASDVNYVYYYDGLNLAAFDKTTGAKLGFIIIAGQNALEQGGIAVDECGNIYVGGHGDIKSYSFTGTTFSSNTSIPLTTTSDYVTDIKYNVGSNTLYVSGVGFGGIYSAVNSLTCTSITVNSQCVVGSTGATATVSLTTNVLSPIISYSWTNSSGTLISSTIGSSSLSNSVTGLANDTYTVMVQLPCKPIMTQTVIINCCALPAIAIVGTGTVCVGSASTYSVASVAGATSYNWLLPAGWAGSSTTNSISVSPSSSGIMTVSATSGTCTSLPAMFFITCSPSAFTLTAQPASLCFGKTSVLNTNGLTSYTWSTGETTNNIIVTPSVSTTYSVMGVSTVGTLTCVDTQTILITITPNTTVTAFGTDSICLGSKGVINALGGTTYTWAPITSVSNPYLNSTIIQPTVTTVYTVTAIQNNLCASSQTINVFVKPLPIIYAGRDTTINLDETYILSGTGNVAVGFLSQNNIPLICNFCSVIEVAPKLTTCYTLMGENKYHCIAKDEVCITVTENYDVFIPNAFTPNADKLNDLFIPVGNSISNIELLIYDRWGAQLFASSEDKVGWDGTYKGTLCEQGIYVYKVRITSMIGEKKMRVGHVTLLTAIEE